jgi:hypothetical protein
MPYIKSHKRKLGKVISERKKYTFKELEKFSLNALKRLAKKYDISTIGESKHGIAKEIWYNLYDYIGKEEDENEPFYK